MAPILGVKKMTVNLMQSYLLLDKLPTKLMWSSWLLVQGGGGGGTAQPVHLAQMTFAFQMFLAVMLVSM